MMSHEEFYALNQDLHLSQETEFLIMSIHSYLSVRRARQILRFAQDDKGKRCTRDKRGTWIGANISPAGRKNVNAELYNVPVT